MKLKLVSVLLGIIYVVSYLSAPQSSSWTCSAQDQRAKLDGKKPVPLPEPGRPEDVIILDWLDQSTEDDEKYGCSAGKVTEDKYADPELEMSEKIQR